MAPQTRSRIALGGALLALATAVPAAAQSSKPLDPARPVFVDLKRLLREYQKTPAFSRYQARILEQRKLFTEEMQHLAQFRYCTEAERKEAAQLKAKPKPTPGEAARLEELRKKADTVDNELLALGQKQNPTESETRRMAELSKLRTDTVRELAKEDADRRDRLRQLETELTAEVEGELLKLVEKVAREQKLTHVYSQSAVLIGGQDITDLVIKKLPAR